MPRCEWPHSDTLELSLQYLQLMITEGNTIPKPRPFNDCVILDRDAFDPDAVFMEDIVDDDVLPKLSLAVDGLTTAVDGNVESPLRNAPVAPAIKPSTHLPVTKFDPEALEVYGWESTLWKKFCGYLGF